MPLEDVEGGWVCTQLDLGWPEVREVVNNRPDADGIDDSTRYFGSRAVSADIVAHAAPGVDVDAVAAQFGPYMTPAIRPELHYVLERPGNPERVLVLRAAGYSWPVDGTSRRSVHLAWVAADPIARDALEKTATAWAGSTTIGGRTYPLTFNRIYPPGGGAKVDAVLTNAGDVAVAPLLRIYGPITAPRVDVGAYALVFGPGFIIDAGRYVEVDCANHTATRDDGTPVISDLVWLSSAWPIIAPAPPSVVMALEGDTTSGVTQVQALWHDGYLS
jgi:hypothetical protein